MKLDFSATNFKAKVTGWRLSIENRAETLFPMVCDTARGIAGVTAAASDLAQLEHHDPQILARANLASDEDSEDLEHEKDDASDRHDLDDNRADNRVDDGNNNEDHNNGGNDLYGPDNELEANEGNNLDDGHVTVNNGDDLDFYDDEEEEHMTVSSTNGGDNGDLNSLKEQNFIDDSSDLTDNGSNSDDVIQVVPAPCAGSCRT